MYRSAIVIVVYLFCFFIIAGCNVKPTVRQIADSIKIDKDWTEIRPIPPLAVSEQIQSISIHIPNLADWQIRPEDSSFVMPDGRVVRIEVQLVSTDGEPFNLQSIGLGPGLMFSRRPENLNPTVSRLPKGKTFTTVRLRSDLPIQGGPVTWICITNY